MVLADNSFMGGGNTLFMFLPFLFLSVGLAFIAVAVGEKRGKSRDRSVRVLPVGAQHPLSHVRHKMKPANQATRPPEQKTGQRRRTEPPWLTRV